MTDTEPHRELARRTDDVHPSPGFTDAVMAAIEQEASVRPGVPTSSKRLADELTRSGVIAIGLAAVAAAACIALSIQAQASFDDEVLVSVDLVEVGE